MYPFIISTLSLERTLTSMCSCLKTSALPVDKEPIRGRGSSSLVDILAVVVVMPPLLPMLVSLLLLRSVRPLLLLLLLLQLLLLLLLPGKR